MEEEAVYENARKYFKIVVWVNVAFLIFTIIELLMLKTSSFPYMAIFFFIEVILFIILFIPSFTYHLIKKRTLKYSASRALINLGDSYQYITPW